jgi:hypothetical protein
MLLADGFDEAFVGTSYRFHDGPLATYDTQMCISILMTRDGMTEEEAQEFFDFNVLGAWVGEQTPVFLEPMTLAEAIEDEEV